MAVGAVAEIKSKLDLAEIIGESVQLKKAGASLKGLCPFHGEKTASFVVTPARETWKCFGCGRGGDLFSFVMERDGIDFPEALRRLAPRAGVELDERSTREDARRKRLRDVLEMAIGFYHRVLTATQTGQAALDYLRGRGFADETVEKFQLGFAPDDWRALSRRLVEKRGVREDELEATGLAARSDRGRGVYDLFRGRVMFPIRDASGGPTGFGARMLERTQTADGRPPAELSANPGPKYLNSRATALFDKSRTLYLIDRAKGPMRRTGRAVIVEGYTDALMAHQAGFENVVAGLGTALTAGQVELATRYAPAIALAYDVDPAGQSAGTFGAKELTALVAEIQRSNHRGRLTDVGVVRLPEGRDPDEVILEDAESWRRATEQPQALVEYLIDVYATRYDPRSLQGRERLVNAVMPVLRRVTDPVERDGYLQLLARRSGVGERVLLEALRRPDAVEDGRRAVPVDGHAGGRISLETVLAQPGAVDPEAVARTLEPVESALLRLILLHPAEQVRISDRLRSEDLRTTPARELYRRILEDRDRDADGRFNRERFVDSLDPTLAALVRGLYARTDPVPTEDRAVERAVEQCLLQLERRRLDELVEFKRAELAEAIARGDKGGEAELLREVRGLENDRLELDRRRETTTVLNRTPLERERTRITLTGGRP